MKKFANYILYCFSAIFIMSATAFAAPEEGVEEEIDPTQDNIILPPKGVSNGGELYRVDARQYADVFMHGFVSHGENDNLQDHLTSRSCTQTAGTNGNANTAFISTTASYDWATNYAIRQLTSPDIQTTHIYRIRPDTNIYDMVRTINTHLPRYGGGLDTATAQSEWVAYRYILSEDISGVDVYTLRDGRVYRTYRHNPYYIERDPVVTLVSYTPTSANAAQHNSTYFLSSLSPIVTACFDAALYTCGGKGARTANNEECTKYQERNRVLFNELSFDTQISPYQIGVIQSNQHEEH